MNLTNKWMNDPQYLAQVGHFLAGALIVFGCSVFAGKDGMWTSLLAGLTLAGIKEFWYDLRYELPKQTIGDSLMDFGFYALGGLAGVGLACTAEHFHRIM